MVLLENANLAESKFNNIVSILVAKAERNSRCITPQVFISNEDFEKVNITRINIQDMMDVEVFNSENMGTLRMEWAVSNDTCKQSYQRLARARGDTEPGVLIDMNDAVEALRNIKCTEFDTKNATKRLLKKRPRTIYKGLDL